MRKRLVLMMLMLVVLILPVTCAITTDSESPEPIGPLYNETDAKEFDPDDLPWDNETDIIIAPILPIIPVPPITPVPIVTDLIEELIRILMGEFLILQSDYNEDMGELNLQIDDMESDIETLETEIEDLTRENIIYSTEVKILKERIVYTQIALLIMAVGGAIMVWKRSI